MAASFFTAPNRCSRNCASGSSRRARGFSTVELLVALAVTGLIGAAALSVMLSVTRMFSADRERMSVNQNLRGGMDLLAIDLRQVGERLPLDFPVVEIIDGANGAPDMLIVRRNLLDEVLPVCKKIVMDTSTPDVRIAKDIDTPPKGCAPVPDDDSDGWPDNLQPWRAARDAQGGTINAYVYNPTNGNGEFFVFNGDGKNTQWIDKADTGLWQYTYKVNQQCRIYVLEERTYSLAEDTLQFIVDGDSAQAINLVHNMIGFQVRAVLADGSTADSFGAADDWGSLRAIEVTLTGQALVDGREITRTLQSRIFPRNILSL